MYYFQELKAPRCLPRSCPVVQAFCVADVRLLYLLCSMELASMLLLFQAAQDSSSPPPETQQSRGQRRLQPLQAICQ